MDVYRAGQQHGNKLLILLICSFSAIVYWTCLHRLGIDPHDQEHIGIEENRPSHESPHATLDFDEDRLRNPEDHDLDLRRQQKIGASPPVCNTKGCQTAAQTFKSIILPSSNPCNDFFDFACGKWVQDNPLKPGDMMTGTPLGLEALLHTKIQEFLVAVPHNVSATHADRIVHKVYNMCIETQHGGVQQFSELVTQLGGPPFTASSRPSYEEIIRLTGGDVFPFFQPMRYFDGELLGIVLAPIAQLFPEHVPKRRSLVKKLSLQLAADFGSTLPEYRLEKGLNGYMNLLTKLEAARPGDNEQRFFNDIGELSARFPNLHLKTQLDAHLQHFGTNFSVIVQRASYFEKLTRIVYDQPEDVLEALVIELFISRFGELGNSYHALWQESKTTGQDVEKECIKKVIEYHPRWVDSMSLNIVYDREDLKSIVVECFYELGLKVREAFVEIVKENPWADGGTQENVIEKVKNMTMHVGDTFETWTTGNVNDFYKEYTPANVSNWFDYKKAVKTFRPSPSLAKNAFRDTQAVVNAFNAGSYIQIMWGILAKPLYHHDAALELLYGAMGFIIGHELTHTFDADSIESAGPHQYLIGAEDRQQFGAQLTCIEEQYGNATLPLNSINGTFSQSGELTNGEAISDNMGLRTAFRGYRNERKRLYGDQSPQLPGLQQYTPDQLFFVGASLFFCGEESDARLISLLTNEHPPMRTRLNEMMKNSQEFAMTYKCPLDSPMNPAKKCRVWRYKKH